MILAIDSATQWVGIGLHDGVQVKAEHTWFSRQHHTVELGPEVGMLLRRVGVRPRDLQAIAVTAGPGGFTGLRIGMALAKGIAMAQSVPLVAVPTLDVLAAGQPERQSRMLAVLEAGRRRIAAVWYKWERDAWVAETEGETTTWKQVEAELDGPTYVCGEIDAAARKRLRSQRQVEVASPALCVRRPSLLAELARAQLEQSEPEDPGVIAPVYLVALDDESA